MKQLASKILFEYWNEVRGRRIAPRRLDIEPARIATVLPECFILERIDPDSYRFRLAGTKICDDFGAELRGQDFLAPWQPDDRAALLAQFRIVTEQAAVALIEFEAWGQRRAVRFEALFLPLLQSSKIDRLLGAMSAIPPPGWPSAERLDKRLLLRHELMWVHRERARAAHGECATSPQPWLGHKRLIATEQRRFRVYEGGLTGPDRKDR